jgi:hypothetical protein
MCHFDVSVVALQLANKPGIDVQCGCASVDVAWYVQGGCTSSLVKMVEAQQRARLAELDQGSHRTPNTLGNVPDKRTV